MSELLGRYRFNVTAADSSVSVSVDAEGGAAMAGVSIMGALTLLAVVGGCWWYWLKHRVRSVQFSL